MSRFPDNVRAKVQRSLIGRGIKINTGGYVHAVQSGMVTLESGEPHPLDFIFLAIGVEPNPIFKNSGLATGPDGGLLVNEFLQSVDHREMFGGGDCMQPFDPGGDYLLIFNLGGGVGVLRKHWLLLAGKAAFVVKDYIDRKFMKKFQAIES